MSRSETQRQIPADSSVLSRPGVSNPMDSKNSTSFPMSGSSRLYLAKTNTQQKKTETKTANGKTANPRPERLPISSNGKIEETKRSTTTTTKATTTTTKATTTTTTKAITTTSQGSEKGHEGGSRDSNPRSLNVQNGVEVSPNHHHHHHHRAKNDGQLFLADSEMFDAVAQSLSGLSASGNSVERRWIKGGHRRPRRTGNEGDDDGEEEEEEEDVTSDMSTPTSGYATDRSTDHHHWRHEEGAKKAGQRLQGQGRTTAVVRAFETPVAADDDEGFGVDEQHPYFARLAAEAEGPTPILGRSGSYRGVRNRVRAGIASLLDKSDGKKTVNYSMLEKGKIVFYTTSVTVVRETWERCHKVKRILQTQMVEFDERDVCLSKASHRELTDRLHAADAELPQVFVDGHHLGGPEEIERLNESGTLRKIFKNFKKVQQTLCCEKCGGFRFVPCNSCRGSKKSKRNCFTDEFCALRCTKCDDNGLVKCNVCNSNSNSNNSNSNAECDEPRQEE